MVWPHSSFILFQNKHFKSKAKFCTFCSRVNKWNFYLLMLSYVPPSVLSVDMAAGNPKWCSASPIRSLLAISSPPQRYTAEYYIEVQISIKYSYPLQRSTAQLLYFTAKVQISYAKKCSTWLDWENVFLFKCTKCTQTKRQMCRITISGFIIEKGCKVSPAVVWGFLV